MSRCSSSYFSLVHDSCNIDLDCMQSSIQGSGDEIKIWGLIIIGYGNVRQGFIAMLYDILLELPGSLS